MQIVTTNQRSALQPRSRKQHRKDAVCFAVAGLPVTPFPIASFLRHASAVLSVSDAGPAACICSSSRDAKSVWPTISSGPTARARPEPAEPVVLPCRGHGPTRRTFPGDAAALPCRGHGPYSTTRRTLPGDAAARLPCRGPGPYNSATRHATRRTFSGDAAVLPWCRGPGPYSTTRRNLPGDATARRSRGPPHLRRALSGGGPAAAEQPAAAAGGDAGGVDDEGGRD